MVCAERDIIFEVQKTGVTEFPYKLPLPKLFRSVAAFVEVASNNFSFLGSGVIIDGGIMTAAHLFSCDVEEIYVSYYSREEIVKIKANKIHMFPQEDLALVEVELPNVKKPAIVRFPKNLDYRKVWSFGCPQGIFGVVWRPKNVIIQEKWIQSTGVVVPGISGGGLLVRYDGRWHVLGIHSYRIGDNTLCSSRVC